MDALVELDFGALHARTTRSHRIEAPRTSETAVTTLGPPTGGHRRGVTVQNMFRNTCYGTKQNVSERVTHGRIPPS